MKANRTWVLVIAALLVGLLAFWVVNNNAQSPSADPNSTHRTTAARTTAAKPASSRPIRSGADPETGLAWIEEATLPAEAKQTLRLIDQGGPYPYDKDGVIFGNFEGVLPKKPRGYYHEYTVPTPGSRDRGARRIVTGEKQYFWTDDHYASFKRIRR